MKTVYDYLPSFLKAKKGKEKKIGIAYFSVTILRCSTIKLGNFSFSFPAIRATTHQGAEQFSVRTRGTQCTTNSFVFLLKDTHSPISSVSEMDNLLKQGDQFHAAFNAFLGRKIVGKLAFDELEESIKGIIGADQTQLQFGPSQHGDILATEPQPPFETLDGALQKAKEATGALLRVGEYTSAVQLGADGSVRLFDPHSRDDSGFVSGDGTAIIVDFKDVKEFHSYLKRFVETNGTGNSTSTASNIPCLRRSFELMTVLVKSKDCLRNIHNSITAPKSTSR